MTSPTAAIVQVLVIFVIRQNRRGRPSGCSRWCRRFLSRS